MKDNESIFQINVRRLKHAPWFDLDIIKYPENPKEYMAVLVMLEATIKKTINDFAIETGFATANLG